VSQAGDAGLARFAPAPGKRAVMAGGLAVFAGLAAWVLWLTPAEAWAAEGAGVVRLALWGAAVLCPLWAADYAVRLARGTPTLVASAEGLEARAAFGATARLRWQEISLIAPVEMGRKRWLAVYLVTPRETLGRLGLLSRIMLARSHGEGVPNLAFRAFQLGVAPEQAAETLEHIRRNPERAAQQKARERR
jgi:hypothetical protein